MDEKPVVVDDISKKIMLNVEASTSPIDPKLVSLIVTFISDVL